MRNDNEGPQPGGRFLGVTLACAAAGSTLTALIFLIFDCLVDAIAVYSVAVLGFAVVLSRLSDDASATSTTERQRAVPARHDQQQQGVLLRLLSMISLHAR